MFETLKHGDLLKKTAVEAETDIAQIHKTIDEISERNEWRVLESYRKHKVSDTHFTPSTGYGYDDIGRDTLEKSMPTSSAVKRPLSDRRSSREPMQYQSLYSAFSARGRTSLHHWQTVRYPRRDRRRQGRGKLGVFEGFPDRIQPCRADRRGSR